MRRVVIIACILLMSLLGWQANADHCDVRGMDMMAGASEMDMSGDMPCHAMDPAAPEPQQAPDADTACCCAVALASMPASIAAVPTGPPAPRWTVDPGTVLLVASRAAEPPPPRS